MLTIACAVPVLLMAALIRHQIRKRRYYRDPENDTTAIEGSLEELNRVDPDASPWLNDEREKLTATHALVARYFTSNGFTREYMEDLQAHLQSAGLETQLLFQEGMPIGALNAMTVRQGSFDLWALKSEQRLAAEKIAEFRTR